MLSVLSMYEYVRMGVTYILNHYTNLTTNYEKATSYVYNNNYHCLTSTSIAQADLW